MMGAKRCKALRLRLRGKKRCYEPFFVRVLCVYVLRLFFTKANNTFRVEHRFSPAEPDLLAVLFGGCGGVAVFLFGPVVVEEVEF